jgi:hypothetical protein
VPIILGLIVRIGRGGNAPYIGVHLMAISNSRYYVYANNPSRILISSYYLRIRVWMGRSIGPLKKGCKKYSEVPL